MVTELINIQIDVQDRVRPSQLWPDWNSSAETPTDDQSAPHIETTRAAIEFLNNM